MQVRRYQGLSVLDMLEALSLPATAHLPEAKPLKLDYLASLCTKLGVNEESRRTSFALSLRVPDDKMSLGACLSIASKLFDVRPISMKSLAHELGRPLTALLEAERLLLHRLDYKVSQPNLHDWLELLLELTGNFVKDSKFNLLSETTGEVADFLYSCPELFSRNPVALLAASAIQASLMLLTGMSGEFLLTRVLAMVLGEDCRRIIACGGEVFELVVS